MEKLMDLNEMNLFSISDKELEEVNGGNVWWPIIVAAYVGNITYEIVNDWENNVKAFERGWKAGTK